MICGLCGKKAIARGLCSLHYSRWWASGKAYLHKNDNPNLKNLGKRCTQNGCYDPAIARTLCAKHYQRFIRGRPLDQVFKNKGKSCTLCTDPAHVLGLCLKHYTQLRRGKLTREQCVKSCIIQDRLYVPAEYVTQKELDQFIYKLDDDDEEDYGSFQTSTREIRTFTKVGSPEEPESLYYGFSRGNMAKLGALFGDLPWQDATAAPVMTSNLQFTKKLFDYETKKRGQKEAVSAWLKTKHGIIRAAPRFGKTVTSIYILTKLRLKTLIITHQKDLLDQFYQTFLEFSNIQQIREEFGGDAYYKKQKKRDATNQIVGYFQDYDNPEQLDVCLLCWQTLASKKNGPERIARHKRSWGMVIVDEVHRAGSIVYSSTVNRLHARYRLGLTGTVERVDGREFIIKDVIGPVTAEGRAEKVKCIVKMIHTNVGIPFRMEEPFPYLFKRIFKNKKRMEIVNRYLMREIEAGHYICLAFHRYSQAQLLQYVEQLKLLGVKAEAFYGGSKDRKGILDRTRAGEIQVLVCNSSMLTGVDIPRWDTYFSVFPNSNIVFNEKNELSGNFYQDFSRVRTPFEYEDGRVKECGRIFDFVDKNNFCMGSSKKRVKAYLNQGFAIEHIKEDLPVNEGEDDEEPLLRSERRRPSPASVLNEP